MSDRHLRVLRAAARRSQRKLEAHDAATAQDVETAATPRDRALQHHAKLSRARLLAAQARRRLHR